MSDFRAEFIEVVNGWKEREYIKFVKWHTCNDDYVCSVCRERDEKEFSLDGIDEIYPAHEGCRCWLTPIVDIDLIKFDFTLEDGEWLQ